MTDLAPAMRTLMTKYLAVRDELTGLIAADPRAFDRQTQLLAELHANVRAMDILAGHSAPEEKQIAEAVRPVIIAPLSETLAHAGPPLDVADPHGALEAVRKELATG